MNIITLLLVFLYLNIGLSNALNDIEKRHDHNNENIEHQKNNNEDVENQEDDNEDNGIYEVETERTTVYYDGIEEVIPSRFLNDIWKTFYSEEGTMEIKIYCLYNRDDDCEHYYDILDRVTRKIDKAIVIKKQITIELFLLDLHYICENNCLSLILPSNYIPLKESGSDIVYSYPQALAKQLDIEGDIKFPKTDILIVLNIDLSKDEIDTMGEFALTREILHGMGIVSTGELVNSDEEQLFSEDFYVPSRASQINLDEDDVNGVYAKFKRFYPLSIFQKYMVTQANPNNYIFNSLVDIYKVEYPKQEYNYMEALKDPEIAKSASLIAYEPFLSTPYYNDLKQIAQMYKQKNSLGFKAFDGSIIPLQTFDDIYIKYISVNHIDIPKIKDPTFYEYDPFNKNEIKSYLNEDFIMNFTYMFMYDAEKIAEIVCPNNKYNTIGSGIIKILKTIGWTERGTNGPNTKYKVADVGIKYDNSLSAVLRYMDKHHYLGFGSSFNAGAFSIKNNVCDAKLYTFSMLVLGLIVTL